VAKQQKQKRVAVLWTGDPDPHNQSGAREIEITQEIADARDAGRGTAARLDDPEPTEELLGARDAGRQ
jgi:hypothetical protein